jgi:hypothetical protein
MGWRLTLSADYPSHTQQKPAAIPSSIIWSVERSVSGWYFEKLKFGFGHKAGA